MKTPNWRSTSKSKVAHVYVPSLKHENMFVALCSVTAVVSIEELKDDGARHCSWCQLKEAQHTLEVS